MKNLTNTNILGCFNELFSKQALKKNIGNYILISIIFIHIGTIIIFNIKIFYELEEKIKDIRFAIYNYKLIVNDKKENNEVKENSKNIKNSPKNNNLNYENNNKFKLKVKKK